MAYVIIENRLGQTLIGSVDTVEKVPVGTIVRAADPVYGAGEFIYLKGVASTILGSFVVYDTIGATTLTTAATKGPAAVAMAATVASTWGWYQITGTAIVDAGTVADNGDVYSTGTPGEVDDAVVDGDLIHLARFASANGTPSAGLALCEINRPYQDQIATND